MSVQTTYANGDTEIWVQYDRRRLNLNDKIILQRCSEVNKRTVPFYWWIIFNTFARKVL